MAEVKDKIITIESLKAVHDYGESNYIKGIQKNGTDLTIDTNRKVDILVPIVDSSDNTESISSTSSSVNLGWIKNESSKKFAPKTFASQVIISSGNVLSDKLSSIDSTISDNYNTLNNKFSSYLPLSGGTISGSVQINGNLTVRDKITGNLTGNVIGNVSGTASNASNLSNRSLGKGWGNVPYISDDGVIEIGKYIDFHSTSKTDDSDYDVRVTCNGDTLEIPKLSVAGLKTFIGPGDTISISNGIYVGHLTSSCASIRCYIPVSRPIIGASSVSFSSPSSTKITVRHADGGYIWKETTISTLQEDGSVSLTVSETGIYFDNTSSSAWSLTNNAPLSVTFENMSFTFS